MDFLIEVAKYYIGIGMIVVMIYWAWNKFQLFKEISEKGMANTKIEPVGLGVYLYVWFWWPGFMEKVVRNYLWRRKWEKMGENGTENRIIRH
jgi:hypothetical protein